MHNPSFITCGLDYDTQGVTRLRLDSLGTSSGCDHRGRLIPPLRGCVIVGTRW